MPPPPPPPPPTSSSIPTNTDSDNLPKLETVSGDEESDYEGLGDEGSDDEEWDELDDDGSHTDSCQWPSDSDDSGNDSDGDASGLRDLDEMFTVLKCNPHISSHESAGRQNFPTAVQTSAPALPPPATSSNARTSHVIKPLPSRTKANGLTQATLISFFGRITAEEAERRRLATKVEREIEEKEKMEFARREAQLNELQKKKWKMERE